MPLLVETILVVGGIYGAIRLFCWWLGRRVGDIGAVIDAENRARRGD